VVVRTSIGGRRRPFNPSDSQHLFSTRTSIDVISVAHKPQTSRSLPQKPLGLTNKLYTDPAGAEPMMTGENIAKSRNNKPFLPVADGTHDERPKIQRLSHVGSKSSVAQCAEKLFLAPKIYILISNSSLSIASFFFSSFSRGSVAIGVKLLNSGTECYFCTSADVACGPCHNGEDLDLSLVLPEDNCGE